MNHLYAAIYQLKGHTIYGLPLPLEYVLLGSGMTGYNVSERAVQSEPMYPVPQTIPKYDLCTLGCSCQTEWLPTQQIHQSKFRR